jgi:hypothetical protein
MADNDANNAGAGAGNGADANANANNSNAGNQNNGADNQPKVPDGYIPGAKFAEVNDELKRYKKAEEERNAAEKQAAEAKMIEDKKYEEVLKAKDGEIETVKAQYQNSIKLVAFTTAALKEGVMDAQDAFKLADLSQLKVNDDGTIEGMDEIVKKLKETKPYLFGAGQPKPPVGAPSNPADGNGAQAANANGKITHKESDVKNPEYYAKNKKDIGLAYTEGRVLLGQ